MDQIVGTIDRPVLGWRQTHEAVTSARTSFVPLSSKLGAMSGARVAPHELSCRMLDLLIATFALLLLGPVMILVALAIVLTGGGPVLFRHTRVGKGGKPFQVLKFRSMANNGDDVLVEHLRRNRAAAEEWARDHKLRVDPRVTAIGGWLRTTSLDELPQLLNVLRGEMSLVGPRPVVQAEVGRYGRAFDHYCAIRPGITGLWQVSGRNNISYRRRVAMDTLYCRRRSLALNLQLLCATIPAVVMRRGSY